MLKYYIKTCESVKRLGTENRRGVFEYGSFAACIIAVVSLGSVPVGLSKRR